MANAYPTNIFVDSVNGLDRANAKSKCKHDSMEHVLVSVENYVVLGSLSTSTFGVPAGGETTRDIIVFVRISNSFLHPLRANIPLSLPCVRDSFKNVNKH